LERSTNDRNEPNEKPHSLQQPWWLGKAERTHVLRNFIIICVVIALLIVGVIILLSQP
jgi:hypothetical protein